MQLNTLLLKNCWPLCLLFVYEGHNTQGETVFSDMSKIAKSASRKELFILIGEITIIQSKYLNIRIQTPFPVHITEKISKCLIRRFLNGCWSMQHQETLVQILPNVFVKNGILFFFSANKCCYINSVHVSNWFAWIFKSYQWKPALSAKTSNICYLKIYF